VGGERSRFHALTSLRWFAALLVFLRHVDDATRFSFHGVAQHGMRQGVQGVAFFFVLSGFVLAWSSSDPLSKAISGARSFWRRRAARIYPAYLVACLLAVAFYVSGSRPLGLKELFTLTFLQSFSPSRAVHFALSPVLWSLSAEAFFYLLFPVLLPALARRSRFERRLLLGLCLAAPVLLAVAVRPQPSTTGLWAIYIFPPTRALEFVAGMLVGLEFRERSFPRIDVRVAALIAVGSYVAAGFGPSWLMWVGFAPTASVLLIAAVARRELDGGMRWLRARSLVALGDVSYCFYLVHFTVLQYLRAHTNPRVAVLTALPVSLAIAATVHYSVERPLERRLRAPRRRVVLGAEPAVAPPLSPA
jgi:peptidoglycan/LPS O-acetylase OafA/YrhL